MKIKSPIRRRKGRLEIIPLIDIMFFLLASFMMVSLQMQKVRTLKANLPTATLANSYAKPDIVNLRVDRLGLIHLEKEQISRADLLTLLAKRLSQNSNLPVSIQGDRDARYGDTVSVLDLVKQAGIQRVAVALSDASALNSAPK
jgi:biopolymer transport protein ExbD